MDTPERSLPSFSEPRVFRKKRQRADLTIVDPSGYEELSPIWPVTMSGLKAYLLQLEERGEGVSYQFLHKQRLYRNLVRVLLSIDESERPIFLARRMRETYRIDPALTDDGVYDLFGDFVKEARDAVACYGELHIPEVLKGPFTSEGMTSGKSDSVEMLLEVARTPFLPLNPEFVHDHIARIRLFTLRRDLVLAERLFAIWLWLQEATAGRSFEKSVTQEFQTKFFIPGLEERVTLRVLLDAHTGNPLRVLAPGEKGDGVVHPVPLVCRYFRDPAGNPCPVFFDPGQKRLDAILFKMMANRLTDPLDLRDLQRFQMVFRSEREMGLGLQVIAERVFPMPGASQYVRDTRRDGTLPRHNPISSEEWRVVDVVYNYGGFRFEGQYHDLENFVRAKTSRGPVHRRKYERRRAQQVLPLLYPAEIFGVDWDDPEISALVLNGE